MRKKRGALETGRIRTKDDVCHLTSETGLWAALWATVLKYVTALAPAHWRNAEGKHGRPLRGRKDTIRRD